MGCGAKTTIYEDPQAKACLGLLSKKPDLNFYKGDQVALKNATTQYQSQVFGGSIFSPIGRIAQGGKIGKRDIGNVLEEDVKKVDIQVLYGGGFYIFKGVKYAANVYADIWMLVESIGNHDMIKNFTLNNNITERERQQREPVNYMDFKQHLNGFGRIIYYQSNDAALKPENCSLIKIVEGRFKQAELDGYCRVLTAKGDPTQAVCEVGYFKENVPNGKYQKFSLEGACLTEGIMEGDQLTKQCTINSYQTRLIKTAKDSTTTTGAAAAAVPRSKVQVK